MWKARLHVGVVSIALAMSLRAQVPTIVKEIGDLEYCAVLECSDVMSQFRQFAALKK